MGGAEDEKPDAYKTKLVNFLGRTVPIILQNDNGPCPLIAICNVLLLRNNISLHKESPEILLPNLLTLVAERLLDSNSNNEDKDENYVQNQQQNISDAISLLPRLATGIDVNLRFRNIHDFEFTPECAIFDLLDIGLVHGWLYDPQDEHTSNAVGSNSYNVLVEKLVALHADKPGTPKKQHEEEVEDEEVDFAAATTASLGVPSPGLCSKKSFEGLQFLDFTELNGSSPGSETPPEATAAADDDVEDAKKPRKGDAEEAAQLLAALKVSGLDPVDAADAQNAANAEYTADAEVAPNAADALYAENAPDAGDALNAADAPNAAAAANAPENTRNLPGASPGTPMEAEVVHGGLKEWPSLRVWVPEDEVDGIVKPEAPLVSVAEGDESPHTSTPVSSSSEFECLEVEDCRTASSNLSVVEAEKIEPEPLYEGEQNFQVSGGFEDREPLYEGEAVLVDAEPSGNDSSSTTEALTIENFLSSHASQLTYYGLFSLQEGLKERELCVFFRNNHFSTMFKYEGDLYLLVTDQGYLHEPDLVWEKLTEVDGDSVFYTGNFTLFKVEEQQQQQSTTSWNERDAVAATADYISSHMVKSDQVPENTGSDYNSDLQLAMALQQQEFQQQQHQQQQQQQGQQESQQQQQQQQNSPRKHSNSPRKGSGSRPSSGLSTGKLFTGPSSSPPPRQESNAKPKDKSCKMM